MFWARSRGPVHRAAMSTPPLNDRAAHQRSERQPPAIPPVNGGRPAAATKTYPGACGDSGRSDPLPNVPGIRRPALHPSDDRSHRAPDVRFAIPGGSAFAGRFAATMWPLRRVDTTTLCPVHAYEARRPAADPLERPRTSVRLTWSSGGAPRGIRSHRWIFCLPIPR